MGHFKLNLFSCEARGYFYHFLNRPVTEKGYTIYPGFGGLCAEVYKAIHFFLFGVI